MDSSKYTQRKINKYSITSHYLEENRQVRVYLPPGYNEIISYPIIYAQDGQDVFMYGRIATITNYLILEKNMEPVIIVGVDVDKKKRTSEYAPDGELNLSYKRFFVEELLPFIEQRYEVTVDNGNTKRLLLGDSLGGTVSLELALENIKLFPNVLILSGALFDPTLTKIRSMGDLGWLSIWMLIGLQETTVETGRGTFNFVTYNQKAKLLLEKMGAELTYLEKDGKHIWGFWQQELPNGLMHFFGEKIDEDKTL